jgi:hypothetical protein
VNGTANVSGSLAASSFSCPEIFTNAIYPWSGGAIRLGDPQGGTVEMGKWQFRGSNPGEFYLERFDDDGEITTGTWYPIATFGFNTNNNSPGMGIDNLGVLYKFTAGNATVSGDLSVAGKVTANDGLDVFNGFKVDNIDVMAEIANKQPQLTSQSILSILRLISSQYVTTNEIRATTANLGRGEIRWK